MKIHDLYPGMTVALTNEEKHFFIVHGYNVPLIALNDHDEWMAQLLLRKGLYELSKDRSRLVKPKNAK